MAGQIWVSVERFASAASEEQTDEAWKLLFANGRPPPLVQTTILLPTPKWERPGLIYGALDATLVRDPKRKPEKASEPSPEDEPSLGRADAPLASKVFGTDPDAPPPPRMPETDPSIILPECRQILVRILLAEPLALAAAMALNRYSVLQIWTRPEAHKDTINSVIDRLCGVNTQLLGAGHGENNSNAPPDTPMRNTEERLRADPTVAKLKGVTFDEFQKALRMLGPEALTIKPVIDMAQRAAIEHARQFVSEKLFQEAHTKIEIQHERVKEALRITGKLSQEADAYSLQRTKMSDLLFGTSKHPDVPKPDVSRQSITSTFIDHVMAGASQLSIIHTYWRTLELSVEISRIVSRQVMKVFEQTMSSLDRKILSELLIHAPIRLASQDPLEPRIGRRKLIDVSTSQLALALQRRRMEAEQKAAFDSLVAIKELIESALGKYDRMLLDDVIQKTFNDYIKAAREVLVPDADRPRQTHTASWKEAYTGTKFPSFSSYVSSFLSPALVRIRTTLYRNIIEEHLARVYGLSKDLTSETSSPLKPPDKAMFTRGLHYYQAFVALRDALLPMVEEPSDAAALVATVDLTFAAHLEAAATNMSVRDSWNEAWKGRLSSSQQATLLGGDTLPSKEWFLQSPLDGLVNQGMEQIIGLASRACNLEALEGGSSDLIERRYATPATRWYYWLQPYTESDVVPGAPKLVLERELSKEMVPETPTLSVSPATVSSRDDEEDEEMPDAPLQETRLPVYFTREAEGMDMLDATIDVSEMSPDEQVIVPQDAESIIEEWKREFRVEYDTRLWYLLYTEVERTYLKRFHPLVKQRGPIVKTLKRLDDISKELIEIEDILMNTRMRDRHELEPTYHISDPADKAEIDRMRAELAEVMGIRRGS